MSSTIDERVVEMTFDNKQFEQGVDSTVKSLDSLKKSLKFDNVGGGLDDFKKAISSIDFSRVTDALDAVISKFSFFGTIKDQILRDFTSFIDTKVIGSLESMVKAMTIDVSAISSGFKEYETKMDAIQVLKGAVLTGGDMTITPEIDEKAKQIVYEGLYGTGEERIAALGDDYAAVQKRVDEIVANNWEWIESSEKVAYTMSDIDDTLEEMNTYADKTIYNFTQMTETLSKFTAAGVDLKEAQKVTIGLSNLAASAGVSNARMNAASIQMAQAMSKANFDATDWMSLTSANMDTEQLRKALVAVGREFGVTEDILTAASKNVKNTLSEKWLTPEIFNEALAIFSDYNTALKYGMTDTYEMAMEAATKIRTVTMLKDTLTEEIQSEWTKSWELIVGSSDESSEALTRLHDVISDLVIPVQKSRNANLQFWHDFGGREAVLNGILNIFEAFGKVLHTVKDAWTSIFPDRGEGGKLVVYSKAFETFSEKLIMSRDTVNKVYRTFKGLFALLDIGIEAFKGFFKALSPVFDLFKKNEGEKGLLDYTASLGDFLVALHDSAIESDFFYNIFSAVVNFILSVPSKIKEAINKLSEYFGVDFVSIFQKAYEVVKDFVVSVASKIAEFAGVDVSGVGTFANGVKDKLSPLSAIGAFLKGVWDVISAIAKKVGPILSALWSVISAGMSKVKDALVTTIDNTNTDTIIDLILSGALLSMILKAKDMFASFSGIGEGIKGAFSGIGDVINGIKDAISAFTLDIKANVLLKIASAIAILALSLWGISRLDPDALARALAAVGVSFGELILTIKNLSTSSMSIIVTSAALIMIATAIDILTLSLVALSFIKPEKLVNGVSAIAAIMFVLTKGINSINSSGKTAISTAVAIIILSNALLKLTAIIGIIGLMGTDTMVNGILGLASIMLILTNGIYQLSECCDKVNVTVIGTIVILSNAIIKMTLALALLGHMDVEQLAAGSLALVVIMTALTKTIEKLAGIKAKSLMSISAALVSISNSCILLAIALKIISNVGLGSLLSGVASIVLIIFSFVEASKLADKSNKSMGKLSSSLVTLGIALILISKSLSSLTKEDPSKLLSVASILSSVILILVLALNNMEKTKGASSMISLSLALLIMTAALKGLSDVAGSDLLKGLMAMAALSVILVGLSYALDSWGKGLITLSSAALKFSAAMLIFSVSLGLLLPSLEKLSNMSWKQLAKIGVALAGLVVAALAMGAVGNLVGGGLISFAGGLMIVSASLAALSVSLSLFVSAMTKLAAADLTKLASNIKMLCEAILENAPLIGETVIAVLSSIIGLIPPLVDLFLMSLADTLGNIDKQLLPILETILSILLTVIEFVGNNIRPIVEGLVYILSEVLYGLADSIGDLTDAIVTFVIAFIQGIADALIEHKDELAGAIIELLLAILIAIGTLFANIGTLLGDIWDKIKEFGSNIILHIKAGIGGAWSNITDFFSNIPEYLKGVLSTVWEKIKGLGSYIIDGFKEGLSSAWEAIKTWFDEHFGWIIDGIKELFEISSPSKVMEEMGGYVVEGFQIGLEDNEDSIYSAANDLGLGTMESLNSGIASNPIDLTSMIGDSSLTPVLDMSEVNGQLGTLDATEFSINTSMNDQLSNQVATSMSDYTDYSEKVVNEISKLRTDVNAINARLDGIQVVLDTGALVGQLTTPINAQLGKLIAFSHRGLFK